MLRAHRRGAVGGCVLLIGLGACRQGPRTPSLQGRSVPDRAAAERYNGLGLQRMDEQQYAAAAAAFRQALEADPYCGPATSLGLRPKPRQGFCPWTPASSSSMKPGLSRGFASDGFTLLSAVPRVRGRTIERGRIRYATTAHSPEQAFGRR